MREEERKEAEEKDRHDDGAELSAALEFPGLSDICFPKRTSEL